MIGPESSCAPQGTLPFGEVNVGALQKENNHIFIQVMPACLLSKIPNFYPNAPQGRLWKYNRNCSLVTAN